MCLLVPALGFPAFRPSQSAQLTSSLHLRTHLMWGSAWESQGWKYVFFFQNSSLVIHFQAARCPQCPAVPSPAVTPVALSPALHCLLAGGGGGGEEELLGPQKLRSESAAANGSRGVFLCRPLGPASLTAEHQARSSLHLKASG